MLIHLKELTGAFLQLINKCWNIVNVKFPSKGLQTRNDCANPAFSSDNDKNLSYLHKFVEWLTSWKELSNESEDNLESRFGIYRQMCGTNSNLSVRQVLEAERKLKIVEVLKIKSASSDLRIRVV